MNIRTILALSIAAAATTVTSAVVAHAEPYDYNVYEFGNPSNNVACTLRYQAPTGPDVVARPGEQRGFDNHVQCDIDRVGWIGPQGAACPQDMGYTFTLYAGDAPEMKCMSPGSVLPNIYSVLDAGQSRTAGAIICTSEPAGMTCTDAASGHFFRAMRDSYHVG